MSTISARNDPSANFLSSFSIDVSYVKRSIFMSKIFAILHVINIFNLFHNELRIARGA